ncbi:unnamed protein product [Cylindrotheca closterium]|uniref:Uncharacterized protein n=1 Tax=Cylindrotheca closterium TaxID=2856 RepID=A0AAD2CRX2_9STRA|nr:unnamed protein product [Cylindrotheca closterium]
MSGTLLPKALMKALVNPNKVAKNLNSGAGSVLSLNIHREKICISVGSYDSVEKLPAISLHPDNASKETQLLHKIVKDHNVCGFVVAWPVQSDTGKWGAPCGRVLFALDKIIDNNAKIFTQDRPLCFWDSFRTNNNRKPVDDMGRCESFGEASSKSFHSASEEQYRNDEEVTSDEIWSDFCKVHLPQVSKRTARAMERKGQSSGSRGGHNLVSDWGDRRSAASDAKAAYA